MWEGVWGVCEACVGRVLGVGLGRVWGVLRACVGCVARVCVCGVCGCVGGGLGERKYRSLRFIIRIPW